jgi:RNA polymerase sigma-70 factor (ECF subfamily)
MDKERFRRAYDTYGKLLYRICVTHVGHADAEDMLHDAFLRYLRKNPQFKDAEHERSWLIRVTVNCCNSRYASLQRRAEDGWDGDMPWQTNDVYAESELLDMVKCLPPKLKSVVVLHCCEGYTLEETAVLLRIGLSAVKMRLSRAREKLKLDLKG